jgi:glucokinase
MISLVADVGGTNTRIALAGPEFGITALRRYRNSEHSGFDEVVSAYCSEEPMPELAGACIGVAGPVAGSKARLTNGNWSFDADDLSATLSAPVHLINDLAALGHAVQDLTVNQSKTIRAQPPPSRTGRALVVGIGTGFNVCQVLRCPDGSKVLTAELGHASLPGQLRKELQDVLGRASRVFQTNEDLFSGSGFSRLHRVSTDGADLEAASLIAASLGNPTGQEAQTVALIGKLLGMMTRELVFQYLPRAGIYFAGSAGCGVLDSEARTHFLTAFDQPGPLKSTMANIPFSNITDDAAGLTGAARVAASLYRPTA